MRRPRDREMEAGGKIRDVKIRNMSPEERDGCETESETESREAQKERETYGQRQVDKQKQR